MTDIKRRDSFNVFCSREEAERRYWDSINLLFHYVARHVVESTSDYLHPGNEAALVAAFPILLSLNVTRDKWDVRLEITREQTIT